MVAYVAMLMGGSALNFAVYGAERPFAERIFFLFGAGALAIVAIGLAVEASLEHQRKRKQQ